LLRLGSLRPAAVQSRPTQPENGHEIAIAFLLWRGLLRRRHVIDQVHHPTGAANVITTVMTMEMNDGDEPSRDPVADCRPRPRPAEHETTGRAQLDFAISM
jgi:hypothetical protein